jgi:hypothetical protein
MPGVGRAKIHKAMFDDRGLRFVLPGVLAAILRNDM